MVLHLLDQKEKRDWSAPDFEEMVRFMSRWDDLYPAAIGQVKHRFPSSFKACMKLLRSEGYEEPIPYNFCILRHHWDTMVKVGEKLVCPSCERYGTRQNPVDYRYISISSRLRQMARTPAYCRANLAHWRARSDWLGKPKTSQESRGIEMWHGQQNLFKRYESFFDPNQTMEIPSYCHTIGCNQVIPVRDIKQAAAEGVRMTCPKCGLEDEYKLTVIAGDPRNIAVMLHWDGWSAPNMGGTSTHKSGEFFFEALRVVIRKLKLTFYDYHRIKAPLSS